ncbi:hypothetical protein KO519_09805 [Paraglaciecola agarilytica]|uniref:hypothetical protein n=1 Tax=Paraglaciecola chathamensis TaxID=368405 RepID=UPI001C08D605|nr:hypothetical protein [Paraglaciecola agarilytica]MBU3017980.1 hypothetical protein [Paraglaciecola agarilytica]
MSEEWAIRQRNTNKLARSVANYVFAQEKISPAQLYGLSKLSWITKNNKDLDASYILSTKIPALGAIFSRDYNGANITEVAKDIERITRNSNIANEILQHTGFTNFYNAYRNSAYEWIKKNFDVLLPMYKNALLAKDSTDRQKLIVQISNIAKIPKANHPEKLMKAEYFLTPTFFMLDAGVKFPLINGNEWVESLLKKLNVRESSLLEQYDAMTKLYGVGGITDAADLDQVGKYTSDFISTSSCKAKKKILEKKETQSKTKLPVKDETDIEVITRSGIIKQRRIHNQLTNKILDTLTGFTLLEGCDDSCMFDVLVVDYDGKNDLIIEVKSSVEKSNIRMAIGQLFDYWYELNGDSNDLHLAILLPERPDKKITALLDWMWINIMWFEDDKLCTSSDQLETIATVC